MRRNKNNVSWVDVIVFCLLGIVVIPIMVLKGLIDSVK